MAELIGSILILLGAFFHFSAGLGMLRMPDVYTRMQAGTKASTLGNMLILAGLAFYHPGWTLKLVILIYFVLMTNPISSHALARAAHADPAFRWRGKTDRRRAARCHGSPRRRHVMRRVFVIRRCRPVRADLREPR